MKKYKISAGHGAKVKGAIGYCDEHDEAVLVTKRVHEILQEKYDSQGSMFVETTGKNQNENLANIVKWHNSSESDIDLSIHFNAGGSLATGTEVFYYDMSLWANAMSSAMSTALGLRNRGGKEGKQLYFLRNTNAKAILLEVCFVSNKEDVKQYRKRFEELCQAIARTVANINGYKAKSGKHVVSKGETLYGISRSNNLTLQQLLNKNPKIKVDETLKIGTKLNI